jgi:hypothetical protein
MTGAGRSREQGDGCGGAAAVGERLRGWMGVMRKLGSCRRNTVWGQAGMWISVVGVCGLAAACAPPPLTSTSTSATTNQSYFYGIFAWSEERDRGGYEISIRRLIEKNGDNYSTKLVQRVTESQGSCLKNGSTVNCSYSDMRQSRDCFRDRCSNVSRSWTVRFRWVDRPDPVDPVVSVQLKVTRQPAT